MRLLHRTGGPAATPELDAQLRSIFDDGRTPGAPETLYSYLREVSMEPATDRGRGILRLLAGLGHMSRTAAALTAVLIIVGAAAAVTTTRSASRSRMSRRLPLLRARRLEYVVAIDQIR